MPDRYEVLCGAFRAGVVVSLCPAVLTESEIALRIRKSGASGFVGEAESIQKMVAIKQAGTVSTSPSMVQIGESTGDSQDAVAYKSLLEMVVMRQRTLRTRASRPMRVCCISLLGLGGSRRW